MEGEGSTRRAAIIIFHSESSLFMVPMGFCWRSWRGRYSTFQMLLHLYFITKSPLLGLWEASVIFNHHNI